MDTKQPDVKEAIAELMEKLGPIGAFMLGEARSFLRKSWGSKEEFMTAVDQSARVMKQSGKMAADDIARTADTLKSSWRLLDKERNLDWDNFLGEIKARMEAIGDVTEETFNICVDQAKEVLDKQWTAMGRLGEEQLKVVQSHSEQMAKAFSEKWSVFSDAFEKTGKKIDRAVQAAWEELKKKDQ